MSSIHTGKVAAVGRGLRTWILILALLAGAVCAETSSVADRKYAESAYAAMREADYERALRYFNLAIEEQPDSLQLHMDRIWAAYNLGRADIWLSDLDYTLGRYDEIDDIQTRYIFTGANRWASKQFQASLAVVARLYGDSTIDDVISRIKTNSYAGFSIAEVGYRVFIDGNPSRFLLPYARALTTLRDQSLSPLSHTLQKGIGVSLKPLLRHNLLLTLERRFAEELAGGDDWMLRGSYSHSKGAEWTYAEQCWDYRNFYADLAHFVDADVTYVALEYQYGVQRRIAERLTLLPYLLAGATANDDNPGSRTTSRIDTGAGVMLQYFAPSSKLWNYSFRHQLILETRGKIAGNNEDDFTVQLKYLLFY